jgi:hypothetical protein
MAYKELALALNKMSTFREIDDIPQCSFFARLDKGLASCGAQTSFPSAFSKAESAQLPTQDCKKRYIYIRVEVVNHSVE